MDTPKINIVIKLHRKQGVVEILDIKEALTPQTIMARLGTKKYVQYYGGLHYVYWSEELRGNEQKIIEFGTEPNSYETLERFKKYKTDEFTKRFKQLQEANTRLQKFMPDVKTHSS